MTMPASYASHRDITALRNRVKSVIDGMTWVNTKCDTRVEHLQSCRLTAVILLGGTVDRTITWQVAFPNTAYDVEVTLGDLEGQATVAELSRTAASITVRVTAAVAVALGAVFFVRGRWTPVPAA